MRNAKHLRDLHISIWIFLQLHLNKTVHFVRSLVLIFRAFIWSCAIILEQLIWKTQATRSGVDTPVDDVEEKIRHWKDDSGVWVNHVAVAHYESDVFSDWAFPPESRAFGGRRFGGGGSGWDGPRRAGCGGEFGERRYIYVIMKTAVVGHSLGCVVGNWKLW